MTLTEAIALGEPGATIFELLEDINECVRDLKNNPDSIWRQDEYDINEHIEETTRMIEIQLAKLEVKL